MLKFWKNHFPNQTINSLVEKVAQRVEWQQDQIKMDLKHPVNMCRFILEDGECTVKTQRCRYRHQFVPQELNKPKFMCPAVHIRFEILLVKSPINYSVRILDYRNNRQDPWTKVHDRTEYMSNIIQFNQYFKNEDNHRSHSFPKLQDLCVVKYDGVFERAIVTDISGDKSCLVAVKLLDKGMETYVKEAELLELPKKFHDFTSNVYNLRIPGLKPYDFEREWDLKATETVRFWLKGYENNVKCYIESQVCAATKDDVWVETIMVKEFLNMAQTTYIYLDVRKELVQHQFGLDEGNSMEMVLNRIEDLFEECRVHFKNVLDVEGEGEFY